MLLVLKVFFDGGNQPDSTQHDVVTLACIAGTPQQWKPFERAWKKNRRKHNAPYLHVTDIVSGNAPFTRDRGWDNKKKDAFLNDCVKIAGKHLARKKRHGDPGRVALYPFTVTIALKDFVRFRSEAHLGPKTAPECLATQALGAVVEWGEDVMQADSYHFVFDQNEPYLGHVHDRKHNRKSRKALPIMEKVRISEGDMRKTAALQLADLFAWCVSQRSRTPQFKWQVRLLKKDRVDEFLDYEALTTKLIPGVAEMVEGWKLPPKKATR